jgi:D-3-phosphoglycerate dehydrogenase
VIEDAIRAGGGSVVDTTAQADMVVWNGGPESLVGLLHPGIRWVQLAAAGVEAWLQAGVVDDERTWMSGAKSYDEPVAEHTLSLILAVRRRLVECARVSAWDNTLYGRPLRGSVVLVVGAGGIGREVIKLLAPFGVITLAVTNSGGQVEFADRCYAAGALSELWGEADVVVLTAPVTPVTYRMINATSLAAMHDDVLIVNVARGTLIDTDALVDALRHDRIGGAALDVTDPSPLPPGHPLWSDPHVLITPHVANPGPGRQQRFAQRVTENVDRILRGADPLAIVDPVRGY